MELSILYEDADIVAVNKPAGLMTHTDGRSNAPTVEDWFNEKYGSTPLTTGPRGYVHRLDRDTSGVLVFAKNTATYEFLRAAFRDRHVDKNYLAFVHGSLKEKNGIIDFDIGRSRKDFRLRSAQPKAKGRLREARTRYEVLAEAVGEYTLLTMIPETGRTHQIRVHLKAIHHPIVGDPLYGPRQPSPRRSGAEAGLGITRLGLHAYYMNLPLPSGGHKEIVAPIPPDLAPAFSYFPGVREKFAFS